MTKALFVALFVALSMVFAFSASAETTLEQAPVVKVAQTSIVIYGLFRMAGLGGAFGRSLSQNQVCNLAGQAFIGFQVLAAARLTEEQVADLLSGLSDHGFTLDKIRASLDTDLADCSR